MPFARINGVELYYEEHGDTGEPLVFVHGYTGDITDWRHQVPEFSRTYRVIVIDNRGHGKSEAPEDRAQYSVRQMADDTEALLSELGVAQYHLLGHSMGGAVAQEIALRSGERLLSLTLHNTSIDFAGSVNHPNIAAWRDYRFMLAETRGMEAVANVQSPFPPPPHMPMERMEETKKRLAGMSVHAFIGAWEGLSKWEGATERAHKIGVQTLVIYGDMDGPLIISGSRTLTSRIPNATEHVVPETGHQPQWERPELFNEALRSFLERVAAPAPAASER